MICIFRNEDICEEVKIAVPGLPKGRYCLKDMVDNNQVMVCDSVEIASKIVVKWHGKSCRALAFIPVV